MRAGLLGRRFRDLIKLHLSDLGGESEASEAEKSLIRRVATLAVELELLEVRFATANGQASMRDIDLYIRATGCLRRVLEALGLGSPRQGRYTRHLCLHRQRRAEARR
jgi:hypothetical protein